MEKNALYIKVEKFLEIEIKELNPEDNLIHIGLDSMKLIELSGILEDELNIEIEPEDALTMKVKDVLKLIESYKKPNSNKNQGNIDDNSNNN